MTDTREVLPIRCSNILADLYTKKFICPGIQQECIFYQQNFITPKQLVVLADQERLKDWKSAIKIIQPRTSLRRYMDGGFLDFYDHKSFCSGKCYSKKVALNSTQHTYDTKTNVKRENSPAVSDLFENASHRFSPHNSTTEFTSTVPSSSVNFFVKRESSLPQPVFSSDFHQILPIGWPDSQTTNPSPAPIPVQQQLLANLLKSGVMNPFSTPPNAIQNEFLKITETMSKLIRQNQISAEALKLIPLFQQQQMLEKQEEKTKELGSNQSTTEQYQIKEEVDSQAFWEGVTEVGLVDEFFESIHQNIDALKLSILRSGTSNSGICDKINFVVKALGLMPQFRSKLHFHKTQMQRDNDDIQREMKALKRKVEERAIARARIATKMAKFDSLIDLAVEAENCPPELVEIHNDGSTEVCRPTTNTSSGLGNSNEPASDETNVTTVSDTSSLSVRTNVNEIVTTNAINKQSDNNCSFKQHLFNHSTSSPNYNNKQHNTSITAIHPCSVLSSPTSNLITTSCGSEKTSPTSSKSTTFSDSASATTRDTTESGIVCDVSSSDTGDEKLEQALDLSSGKTPTVKYVVTSQSVFPEPVMINNNKSE